MSGVYKPNHKTYYNRLLNAIKRSKSFELKEYSVKNGVYRIVFRYYPNYNNDLGIQVTLKPNVYNSFYLYVYNYQLKMTYWNNVPITIKWWSVRDIKSLIDSRIK